MTVFSVLLLLTTLQSATAPSTQPSADALAHTVPALPTVGVVAFTAGEPHAAVDHVASVIRDLAKEIGTFRVIELTPKQNARDLRKLDAARLASLNGLVWLSTTGPDTTKLLTDEQRSALLSAVKSGMGFVAIHSTANSFRDWPAFAELLGARAEATPWTADGLPVTVRVEDQFHPACERLSLTASWFLLEEIYQFGSPYDRERLHLLMSLDPTATDFSVPGATRTDNDYAIAWSKLFGEGRVFYTTLGASAETWEDPIFHQHLLGGIRWSVGQVAGKPDPREQWEVLPSGVRIRDLVVGEGELPKRYDKLMVAYKCRRLDGTVISESEGGEPLEVTIGYKDVIDGLEYGVTTMKLGGKRKILIPAELAYGVKGAGDDIPPNTPLVFEVEVVEIKRHTTKP